jgi:uncharacterized membrane protein YfcA
MILLIFLIAILAFCVSAVAGGGAGLVLVPLLRLLLPVAQVPAALSIGTATGSLARIHAFRHHIRWDVVRWFAPAALPMAGLGAWALSQFEPAYVELLIGMFLLANLPAIFRRTPPPSPDAKPISRPVVILLGALAGLISGFTGAVGLLFNRVYARMGMSKEELVATRAANEIALHALKIALYAAFGLLSRQALVAGAFVALAAVVAAYGMRPLIKLVNEHLFRTISHVSMVAAGAAMFTMSSGQIMAIHRAWTSYVQLGDDREFQLYWEGHRRFALEFEEDGTPVIERGIDADDLTSRQLASARVLARDDRIELIEQVFAPSGRYIEIYVRRGHAVTKYELHGDGSVSCEQGHCALAMRES